MKKTLAVAISILAVTLAAWATINLSAGSVQTHQQGGITVETADTASVVEATNRFGAQVIEVRVAYGQLSNGKFVSGSRSQSVLATIDIGNCRYSTSDGAFAGNIPGALCTSLSTSAKNYQDKLENLVISAGIAPGTQVAN